MNLTNAGDQLVALDPCATILDVVVFGASDYPGLTSFVPSPGLEEALSRLPGDADTDNCQTDFRIPCGKKPESMIHA